jgi:transcriptional regulator MraZ
MPFLGEYQHTLDAKGRIFLPSKFRGALAEGCFLARGQDRCLFVFDPDEWERLAGRLKDARLTSRAHRDYVRLFFSGASEQMPDAQGRITIPENLRAYARLERDIAVLGLSDRIEVWDAAAWAATRAPAEDAYADMTEALPDLPI